MSSPEQRAWLTLCSMCPAYFAYFVIQIGFSGLVPTIGPHLVCLAIVAGIHAVIYIGGTLVMKRRERGENLLQDERDRGIDARATRVAYFFLLAGMIYVGVVMPFAASGWTLVNASLLVVVVSETLRNTLIVIGYRRRPRLAH